MGFKKSKAFEEIRVPMIVSCADEIGTALSKVEVAHIFHIPTPAVREEWQRKMIKVKGKKVTTGSKSDANWGLWLESIKTVEGYDDIDASDVNWKKYFDDPIGRIHVDNAVDMLMEVLSSEEVEQEKKSEPSSEL